MRSSNLWDDSFFSNEPDSLSNEPHQISILTRRNLHDELLLLLDQNSQLFLSGKLEITTFLKRIWALDKMPSTDFRFIDAEGDIRQHMVNNDDWDYAYLFNYLGLIQESDYLFLRFLEELVHPIVRNHDQQVELVTFINKHIERDGFTLQAVEQISGFPIYRANKIGTDKVRENVKNLIFAADGPKPEIVIDDSISNNIRIVKNKDNCLVYDQLIPNTGLKWIDLAKWWASTQGQPQTNIQTERSLYSRLAKSLASPPEKLFFSTYYKQLQTTHMRDKLPALIPQVYLHYDPYTIRELQDNRRLARQRMDFLILFSNYERVVIEIDGKQHYSENDKANPEKYSEMVAEDRKLRLAGYEIYRFGGYELSTSDRSVTIENFIQKLFKKHRIM